MPETHFPPEFQSENFHCPNCGVYAHQTWYVIFARHPQLPNQPIDRLMAAKCQHCSEYSLWIEQVMIYPLKALGPSPHDDMPEDVKEDYEEARKIAAQSPRGACALLRLGLQKLCIDLGQSGENLNTDIGGLVRQRGLLPQIQQSLDALRVIGNNAVHPGTIDLRDDHETVTALLSTMNVIVEQLIAAPKHAEELYAKVPQAQKEAIAKREGP
jgi:hypothetical protein